MKKLTKSSIVFGMILTLGACSSSSRSLSDNPEEIDPNAPVTDAQTDAVPMAATENPDGTANTPSDPAVDGSQGVTTDGTTAHNTSGGGIEPSPAGNGTYEDYTVQQGDTLMKIAFETYGDLYRWKGLLEANKEKVTNPNSIPAGTVLKVERPSTSVSIQKNGDKYLIKNGDTLGTISNEVYGTKSKWKALWENNKQLIHDPNRIFAGFYLYYTADGSVPASSPEVTPAPMADASATGAAAAPTADDASRAPASSTGDGADVDPATADAPPAVDPNAVDTTSTQ